MKTPKANHTCAAIGISVLGLIAALVCNLAFLKAILGFFLGAGFFAASIVCQAVFVNKAFFSVEDAGLDESVVSLRYTPKDGTILPITVCTEDDLLAAQQTAAARHVIFCAAYCLECLMIAVIYIKKRAK